MLHFEQKHNALKVYDKNRITFLQHLIQQSKKFWEDSSKLCSLAKLGIATIHKHIKICSMSTIKHLTLTTKYARGKIIIIYQRNCSAQAIEVG